MVYLRIEILNMTKKMFLKRAKATPIVPVPSISSEEPESEVPFSSMNNPVSEIREQLRFMILDETSKTFPKFNATGLSVPIKFRPLGEGQERRAHLKNALQH